jgi:aminoglycoside phosphotransferase
MPASGNLPNAALAADIATNVTGHLPIAVTRFTTGAMHYVFEVAFAHRPPVVVRIAAPSGAKAMRGASMLSGRLRPLGIPLPAILAEELGASCPWLVLERFVGTDLGNVVDSLGRSRLKAIAGEVARAQAVVAQMTGAGLYGYAVDPAEAPHTKWSAVVIEHLERSRARIAKAGFFDLNFATAAAAAVQSMRTELDAIPPTPFLHDTTTKNVIVTADGAFSGIVDVDDLCFGDPRYVIALTRASLLALGCDSTYSDTWLEQAGLTDDRLFQLYVALFLLDFMSEHGQRFNGNKRPSQPDERQKLQELFSSSLDRASMARA